MAHQRELHEDEISHQVDEAGPGRPRAALGVEHAEHRAELRVIARLEPEDRRFLVVAADLDRVLVREPVGGALVRKVGGLRQERTEVLLGHGERRLQFLELCGDLRDLVDQLLLLVTLGGADRFRRTVLRRSQLLDT